MHSRCGYSIMTPWRILEFVTGEGAVPFQEWYESLDPEAQAALDDTIFQLTTTDDWTARDGKEFRQFTKKEAGLSEIRFWVFGELEPRKFRRSRRRLRALGLYRPGQREFILLGGYEKRWGGYVNIPGDALSRAMDRKQDFAYGKGATRDHV